MACFGWVFFKGMEYGKVQKYTAVFNSQSNWLPLWKINFSNEFVFWQTGKNQPGRAYLYDE